MSRALHTLADGSLQVFAWCLLMGERHHDLVAFAMVILFLAGLVITS